VQEHLKAHHDDPHQSLAALSSASSLRQHLSRLGDADVQASIAAWDHAHEPAEETGPYLPRDDSATLRYRILRPHAKGGLGEVYVAEDQELRREVALKQIQPQFADAPQARGRFLLEAEVTGGLEHPGIVPVYGLGHYADGRPFYAMRFVRGDNLKEAVRRFHEAHRPGRDPAERNLALRGLLGRFVDVCQAVAYAHSRGVLHRDLKPGNILLGKFGETLVVDWGLAKVLGRPEGTERDGEMTLRPSSGSGVAETQAGSAVGTPSFMSPEQAAGRLEELGPASDVYSLGATLYHLLTGQAPFRGADPGEILQQVGRGEFVPPRRVKPEVPASLEAVCLKAMALRPRDRYVSALALAADVEHWLADEPIAAYREPVAVRLRRWARRNRTLVAGAAAALVVAVVLGGGGWSWLEQRRAAVEGQAREELQRARLLQGEGKWPEAVAAAKRAEGLLAALGSADLRRQASELLADSAMVGKLEEIRLTQSEVNDNHLGVTGCPLLGNRKR
jgi:serine/threonine-protein kinase